MPSVPPPRPADQFDPGSDEMQWQRASNEGWPERDASTRAWPPGAIAPAVALASNVVDLRAWRIRRDSPRDVAASS